VQTLPSGRRSFSPGVQMIAPLKHDREKVCPDLIRDGYRFFEKDHAQTGSRSGMTIRRKVITPERAGAPQWPFHISSMTTDPRCVASSPAGTWSPTTATSRRGHSPAATNVSPESRNQRATRLRRRCTRTRNESAPCLTNLSAPNQARGRLLQGPSLLFFASRHPICPWMGAVASTLKPREPVTDRSLRSANCLP
jgi:hypothetical protein